MYPDMVVGYAAAVDKRDELEHLWKYDENQFGKIDI
ncbi:hypothetical protein J2Y02_003841 [Neobacillus drentensis]|nr:hypothetical protein [Neobacillus drentensis]